MRWTRIVLEVDGLGVAEVSCRGRHGDWSAEEPVTGPAIVLVRSGVFRRRVNGRESVVDATTAYYQRPGSVQQVAHPCGGDRCTVIEPSAATLGELAEFVDHLTDVPVGMPTAIDVDHRAVVASARNGADAFELAERATVLAGRVTEAMRTELPRLAGSPSGGRGRWLADQAREALAEDSGLGLHELASRIGVSTFHLSRTFRTVTGRTLSWYRRQLRLRRALEGLEAGNRDLARLATDAGFSDQAHLTRAMRADAGFTPGALRALLGPSRKEVARPMPEGGQSPSRPMASA